MSIELEYESNSKSIIEKCCAVINAETDKKKAPKEAKRGTRLRIDAILDKRALLETIELGC